MFFTGFLDLHAGIQDKYHAFIPAGIHVLQPVGIHVLQPVGIQVRHPNIRVFFSGVAFAGVANYPASRRCHPGVANYPGFMILTPPRGDSRWGFTRVITPPRGDSLGLHLHAGIHYTSTRGFARVTPPRGDSLHLHAGIH